MARAFRLNNLIGLHAVFRGDEHVAGFFFILLGRNISSRTHFTAVGHPILLAWFGPAAVFEQDVEGNITSRLPCTQLPDELRP